MTTREKQSAEMEAASSSVAAAAPGTFSDPDPARGGMQVDEELNDLEYMQMKRRSRRKGNHALRGGSFDPGNHGDERYGVPAERDQRMLDSCVVW